jgi:hypothetical protein
MKHYSPEALTRLTHSGHQKCDKHTFWLGIHAMQLGITGLSGGFVEKGGK